MMKPFIRRITKRSNPGEAATPPTGSQEAPAQIFPATGTTSEARMPAAVTGDRATGQGSHATETLQNNNQATLEAPESTRPLGKLKTCSLEALMSVTGVEEPSRLAGCVSDFIDAIKELEEHNKEFVSSNPGFITIKDRFDTAFREADANRDIRRGSQVLSKGILAALQTLEVERNIKKDKWTTKVGNFLKKLYPVARLSLNLTGAVVGVSPDFAVSESKGVPISYLKGTVDALSVILQVSWTVMFKADRSSLTKNQVVEAISCVICVALSFKRPY
jgi:hypothetical protein